MLKKSLGSLAVAALTVAASSSATAGLVVGDSINATFLNGGWSLALSLNPSSSLTIGAGPEAIFNGSQSYPFGPGSATYTVDFYNDSTGRSFLDITAAFSTDPSSQPSIGANFLFESLDFGPNKKLVGASGNGVFVPSVTDTSVKVSLFGVKISTTPQTRTVELFTEDVQRTVPEPSTVLSAALGLLGVALSGRRRQRKSAKASA